MREDDWRPGPADLPETIGGQPYDLDVCPGWVARQPGVVEVMQAYTPFDKGALGVFFPDPPNHLLEGVLAAKQAFSRYESESLKKKNRQ